MNVEAITMGNVYEKIKRSGSAIFSQMTDIIKRATYERKFYGACDIKDLQQIILILDDMDKTHQNIKGIGELLSFIKSISETPISSSNSYYLDKKADIIERLYYQFQVNNVNKLILNIPEVMPYDSVKEVMTGLINHHYQEKGTLIIPFLISKNTTITGRVINSYGAKSDYILTSVRETSSNNKPVIKVNYLGDEKHTFNSEQLTEKMYMYTMMVSDRTTKEGYDEYTLISPHMLPMEEIIITGMLIPINDKIKIGNEAKMGKNTELIYVTDFSKVIKNITYDEFKQLVKKYDSHDKLYEEFFGKFRHPEIFEKFLLSLILSSKGTSNYPSSFGMFGPPACGKSKLLNCVTSLFNEIKINENTTLKGIVPSYGGSKPNPGYFLKSRRFCAVDEFLNIIVKKENIEDIDILKSLLVHDKSVGASGKHDSAISINPTASMWFASNFMPGRITNFIELTNKLSPALLGRFILYNFSDNHTRFINERVMDLYKDVKEMRKLNRQATEEDLFPKYNTDVIMYVDYLKEYLVDVDVYEVANIYKEVKEIVPEDYNISSLYNSRSQKHIESIIDGITKVNYILENREGEIVPIEKDYEDAKAIWYYIISSWVFEPRKLPIKYREQCLTTKEMQVYLSINKEPGQTLLGIENNVKFRPHTQLNKLLEYDLIKIKELGNNKFYNPVNYTENQ